VGKKALRTGEGQQQGCHARKYRMVRDTKKENDNDNVMLLVTAGRIVIIGTATRGEPWIGSQMVLRDNVIGERGRELNPGPPLRRKKRK